MLRDKFSISLGVSTTYSYMSSGIPAERFYQEGDFSQLTPLCRTSKTNIVAANLLCLRSFQKNVVVGNLTYEL